MEKAYLVLEDGTVFPGERIGARRDAIGELVFTTGMVGYLETLSDPSYAGQIIMQTFPLIGNYGVTEEDLQGKCAAAGYVVRELCATPSNFRSTSTLETYLKAQNVPGICGVDTREITKHIRAQGVMSAIICQTPPENLDKVKNYQVKGYVNQVSTHEVKVYPAAGERKYTVALIDYGTKKSIIESLTARGCRVAVFPHNTPAERIISFNPDGLVLSNGPGDPVENIFCIEQLKRLIGKMPLFGICLGHQLVALALGGKTVKLKYGHHGANQPVHDLDDNRTYITSQNHGYAVISESLKNIGRETFINADDGSCEGIEYRDRRCFTVQFHPEACSGPKDTGFLFDKFIGMMGGEY